MKVEQIKAFHKVASTGSFTKAAGELFVTQPAVSQEIKALETFLGTRLFHRSGKKIQLTAEGKILFSYSHRLFSLHEEMESLFSRSKNLQYGQIKIGSTALMGTYFLPEMIGRFNRKYPRIEIDLQMGNSSQIMQLVLEGMVDLGFSGMITHHARLDCILIHQERLVMVGSPHHALSSRKISLEDLSEVPFIWREKGTQTRKLVEKWFYKQFRSRYPRKSIELQNMEAAKRMVEEGFGITVIPETAVRREMSSGLLRRLPLEELNVFNSYYLISLKGKRLTRAAEAFEKVVANTPLLSFSENLRTTLEDKSSRNP